MWPDQRIGFRAVLCLQALCVPFESLADPVGDVAEQHTFGQRSGIVEVARSRPAGFDGLNPLLVVAYRIGDGLWGWNESFELVFGEELVAAVVGEEHAL